MKYLLDSNYIFALKTEKDKFHSRAKEILKQIITEENNYITTIFAISETFTLAVSRYRANFKFIKNIYDIVWGEEKFLDVIYFSKEDYKEIYGVLKKYSTPKRLLSFVDASLIYLYQKFNADQILSFDSHFDNILNRLF